MFEIARYCVGWAGVVAPNGGDRRRGADLTFTVGQKRPYNLGTSVFFEGSRFRSNLK